MKRNTTALIKDLELQIDFLVGYSPQGLHWKREYHFREELINNVLCDVSTPQETIEKIARIQGAIYDMRSKQPQYQGYIGIELSHDIVIKDYNVVTLDVSHALPIELMDKRQWKEHDLKIEEVIELI